MKYVVIIISLLNLYIGIRFLLNVISVLQTSKYSKRSTTLFALFFLLLSAGGFYYTFYAVNYPIALVIGAGPWVVGLFVLMINFISEDYK
jgi:hypothetical protein